MSWNLNSLAKDNFKRFIEAHNCLFNYDLISICETSLNDTVEIPEPLLNEYTFVSATNPANKRHGGVGLFYKNFLPIPLPRNLHTKIKAENPFATFFTGDFNAHSQLWWTDGDTTPEGTGIENLLTSLGLYQVISEPTNFEPNKNPLCIDLAITDQPNLILDSGTRPSLDPYCHHQIIFCKVNLRILPPPPIDRKIWHFNRANSAAIKKSMSKKYEQKV